MVVYNLYLILNASGMLLFQAPGAILLYVLCVAFVQRLDAFFTLKLWIWTYKYGNDHVTNSELSPR